MGSALDEAWAWLVRKLLEWALSSIETLLSWWMSDSAFNVQLTGEKGGTLYALREHINWLTAVMAFAGFLFAAFRIAIQRKGEPFRELLSQFFVLAIIVFTMATAVNLANMAIDGYSSWIIKDMSPHGDAWIDNWNTGISALGDGDTTGGKADTAFILAAFAFAAAVSTAIQFGLMLFRSGALIILVGILPALAASRFSSYGDAAYRKSIGLVISLVVFKGLAATIYAAAESEMASKYESDRLFGLALVAGAVFALPATMRAIMPAVAENNGFFGIRQVGHFTFGGTAVNVGKGTGIWTRLTGIGAGGGSGGSRPGGGSPGGRQPSNGGNPPGHGGSTGGGGSGNGGNPAGSGGSSGSGGWSNAGDSSSGGDSSGGDSTGGDSSSGGPSGADPAPSAAPPLIVPSYTVPEPDFSILEDND